MRTPALGGQAPPAAARTTRLSSPVGTSGPPPITVSVDRARRPARSTRQGVGRGRRPSTVSASSSWKPSGRVPSTRSVRVSLAGARASSTDHAGALTRPPAPGAPSRRASSVSARGRGSMPAAVSVAATSVAELGPQRAAQHLAPLPEPGAHEREQPRPATAPSTGGAAWRTARTSADSTRGAGMNTLGGTMPTTRAGGEVRDLHRHRAVGLGPGPGGEPLAHLALHHHEHRRTPRRVLEQPHHDRCRHVVRQVRHRAPRVVVGRRARRRGRPSSRRRSRA